MWRSEDSFQELVHFLHHLGSRDPAQVQAQQQVLFPAGPFPSPVLAELSYRTSFFLMKKIIKRKLLRGNCQVTQDSLEPTL